MIKRCITCGRALEKTGLLDPYQCRACEKQHELGILERYSYLDV
jgi:DNA-directed RNA polymerase subunit RPC12/RpoP